MHDHCLRILSWCLSDFCIRCGYQISLAYQPMSSYMNLCLFDTSV